MEEGEIPSSKIKSVEEEEKEESPAPIIPLPPSPRNERNEKCFEGSTTPEGSWAEMIKHRKATQQGFSPKQSPPQELHDVAMQLNTRGRKSQRYHIEHEVEREIELGRQRSLEETKLLQYLRNPGGKKMEDKSQVGSQSLKN